MKIVEPSFDIVEMSGGKPEALISLIERSARVCYKTEKRITDSSAEPFIRNVIKRGHEAVLEHGTVTARIICDRGVSHEIVRHRIAAYCQESTRYCNYSKNDFGHEIAVIRPFWFEEGSDAYAHWYHACVAAEDAYFALLQCGYTAQQARTVLPNSLKTELIVTMNIREWRHFFKLRCASAAHPQMVEVARKGLLQMYKMFPVLFDDVFKEVYDCD